MSDRRRAHARRLPSTIRIAGGALTMLLAACGSAPEPPPPAPMLSVFGQPAHVVFGSGTPQAAADGLADARTLLNTYQQQWHAWQPSELTRINGAFARGEAIAAPESIRLLVERARPLVARTDGLFDPAIGGLVELWGFHTAEFPVTAPPPDAAALHRWRTARPRLVDVRIDGERLLSRNPHVQLDFGAIAEGVVAESLSTVFRRHGLHDALIDMDGDAYALGANAGSPWTVELRDPLGGAGSVLATLPLGDGEALFTAGNYARYRIDDTGERWPHILDPRTGLPARGVALIAVVHEDPVLADAATAALVVAGPARFAELLHRLDIRCALLLTDHDELMITSALSARLQLQRRPQPLGPPLGAGGACSGSGA